MAGAAFLSLVLLTLSVNTLGDSGPIITLNIGGLLFATSANTILRYPDCLIAQDYRTERTSYFYDRDGELFRHVLNYLRVGKLLLPRSFDQLDQLKEEARFFELYSLHDDITELQAKLEDDHPHRDKKHARKLHMTQGDPSLPDRISKFTSDTGDVTFECVIVCADEDGKIERWFSAPVDLRFENNGCLLGDCDMMTGYSHILDYRDYTARPGNTVPDQFNIAAIVARLLKAGFELVSSSSGLDEWHREFYFVLIRKINKSQ
uniref:Potassium channel tetramerisation-type BTB domain-containing protein n=1 Tax=Homalodisca liturata TaxID=320908 RepID=A0A1B6IGI3_9HEMI